MNISLVIPAYNEEKYIGRCLESVEKYGAGLSEVIVINNASTDRTGEIARTFSNVRVIDELKKGRPFARDRGSQEARGDFLAYIDADCVLPPDWVSQITAGVARDPRVICLSGPYRYYDLPPISNFFAQLGWWLSAPITYRIAGYALLAGNFVAKKDVFMKIGGFNDEVLFYGDDTDLGRRLSAHGKVRFDMDFFVYTSGRRLLESGLFKTFFLYGLNFIWEAVFKRPFSKSTGNE